MLIGRVIIIKVKDVLNDLLNFVYLLFNFYYNFVGELLLFLFDRCRGFRKVKLFVEGFLVKYVISFLSFDFLWVEVLRNFIVLSGKN